MSADPDVPVPEAVLANNDPIDLPDGCYLIGGPELGQDSAFLPDGTLFATCIQGGADLAVDYIENITPPDQDMLPPVLVEPTEPAELQGGGTVVTRPAQGVPDDQTGDLPEGERLDLPPGCFLNQDDLLCLPDGTQIAYAVDGGRQLLVDYIEANTPPPQVAPSLEALIPPTGVPGAVVDVTLAGRDFTSTSVVRVNDVAVVATYYNPTQMSVSLDLTAAADGDVLLVTVENGALVSDPLEFSVAVPLE